jgi:hypothetical protein
VPQPNSLTVKLALTISFVLLSAAGGSLFFIVDAPRTGIPTRNTVALFFIVIVAVVHWIGYCAWRLQRQSLAESGVSAPQLSRSFVSALKTAVIVQFVLLVLTGLMLDGGWMGRLCMVAIIGHWVGIGMIAARRGSVPTSVDLLFMRYGAAILTLAAPLIAGAVYNIIGESDLSGLERLLKRR